MTRALVIIAYCDFCGTDKDVKSVDFTADGVKYELDYCDEHDFYTQALIKARKIKERSNFKLAEYSCEHCHRNFTSKSGLTRHVRASHREFSRQTS